MAMWDFFYSLLLSENKILANYQCKALQSYLFYLFLVLVGSSQTQVYFLAETRTAQGKSYLMEK